MRTVLLVLASFIAVSATAVGSDWYEDLSSRTQFRALAELRAPLDAAPEDPALLGRAALAYVSLGIGAAPAEWQAPGPFLAYARTCLDRRAAKIPLAGCATIADAAPELWYLAQVGRRAEVGQVLDRLPDAAASPVGRALRCLVDRDWRALEALPQRTAIENYALIHAYAECGLKNRVENLRVDAAKIGELTGPDCFFQAHVFSHQAPSEAVRQALADTVLLLTAQSVAEDQALALAKPLAAALGVSTEGARAAMLGRITGALRAADPDQGGIVGAAWEACTALLAGPAGIRDAQGAHRLFQAGDVAAWARDRLALAAWMRLYFTSNQLGDPDSAKQLWEGVIAASPDGFLGHYLRVRANLDQGGGPGGAAPLLAAIDRELPRAQGRLREDLLLRGTWAATRVGGAADGRPARLLALPAGGAVLRWVESCRPLGIEAPVMRRLTAARLADPANFTLRLGQEYGGPAMPAIDGIPPDAEDTASTVDHPDLPFAGIARQECFALRWTGTIDGGDGDDELAVSSDDGTVLIIDDATLVDNGGGHGTQLKAAAKRLPAGWHDLRLDFYQGNGGASCRLLLRAAGGEWQPVPAARLGHRAETRIAPGLQLAVWNLPRFDLARTDLRTAALHRWFAKQPWRLTSRAADARMRLAEGDRDGALASLLELNALEPGSWDIVQPLAEAKEKGGDIDGAAAAYQAYAIASSEFSVIHARRNIGRLRWQQSRRAEAEEAFRTAAASWQSTAMTDYADYLTQNQRFAEAATWWDNDAKRYDRQNSRDAALVCRYLGGQAKAAALLARRQSIANADNADYTPMVLCRLVEDPDPDAAALLADPREAAPARYLGWWKLAAGDLAAAHNAFLDSASGNDAAPWFRAYNAMLGAALEAQPGDANRLLRARLGDLNEETRGLALGILDGTWPALAADKPGRPRSIQVLKGMRALAAGDRTAALRELDGVTSDDDAWRLPGLAPALRRIAGKAAAGPMAPPANPANF